MFFGELSLASIATAYRYWPLFQLCYGDSYSANLEEYCLQFTENVEAIATPTSMMHVAKRFDMGAPCRVISASFPPFPLITTILPSHYTSTVVNPAAVQMASGFPARL